MTMVRVLWVFFRLGVLNELQYRVNFVVQLLSKRAYGPTMPGTTFPPPKWKRSGRGSRPRRAWRGPSAT
jgi:hypothetical protein